MTTHQFSRDYAKENTIAVPARPLAEFAFEAAADLRATYVRLSPWMPKAFPPGCRLFAALRVLDEASEPRVAPGAIRLEEATRALELALDMKAIADAIPDERVRELTDAVRTCMSGPLDPKEPPFDSLQRQSELVVRAALHRAGVPPLLPRRLRGASNPDVQVENGSLVYGLEVKRPTAARNILPRAREGADQLLGARLRGGIVVDATDCVDAHTHDGGDTFVTQCAQDIASEFFAVGEGWKNGSSHVIMVTVFARPKWIVAKTGGYDYLLLSLSVSAGVALGRAEGTLDIRRARWLREALATGLNAVGFTDLERMRR